jgi:hypothetical protein
VSCANAQTINVDIDDRLAAAAGTEKYRIGRLKIRQFHEEFREYGLRNAPDEFFEITRLELYKEFDDLIIHGVHNKLRPSVTDSFRDALSAAGRRSPKLGLLSSIIDTIMFWRDASAFSTEYRFSYECRGLNCDITEINAE